MEYIEGANLEEQLKQRKGQPFGVMIAAYTEAIRLEPNNADAYFGRAVSHEERNELDLAVADYDQAIRLNPNYASAYNNRGLGVLRQRQVHMAK